MDKKAIIQELRAWHDAVFSAQARPFLEPFGLTMRFDADVFDEDERQDTGCISLYKGGSVFWKEIIYWINYESMADCFIQEDDCSQDAYKEQMHITIFHVIGSALVEMFSDLYGQGDETFDASVDDLPEGPLRPLLQGDCDPKLLSALSEEFAVCHQDNRAEESPLYRFCMQYLSRETAETPVLQEGMAYTIRLKDGRKIANAIYYACIASGKPYFSKDNEVYPAEDVQSHSLIGHNVPDNYREEPDPDRLAITDDVIEVIEVTTTPTINPEMFRRRVRSHMLSGLPQQEAEKIVASTPQKLELFYDINLGAFAIDAEAVGNTPLYNPYTGKEIPDETK